jgi:hypothetical protein
MSKSFIIFFIIVVSDILLDFGKWSIGRYTEVTTTISIMILIFGSCIIAIISKHISELKGVKKFIEYLHHGKMCWTREDMKDKHWNYMICPDCIDFEIQKGDNNRCYISAEVHELCLKYNLVLSVWECPIFKKKKKWGSR